MMEHLMMASAIKQEKTRDQVQSAEKPLQRELGALD
jgi:hypothetical protein